MSDQFFDPNAMADALRIKVEALGEPGNRRFRLLASVAGETYIAWMEKQQLQALGLAIEQLLQQIPPMAIAPDPGQAPVDLDTETRQQFRVGRMELGYDERQDKLIISAHNMQTEDEPEERALNLRVTRQQAQSISADAEVIVAAGRPLCPLCGSPMTLGESHVCPQQNGHLPLSPDEDAI
jgi:uncharacterized repeat protein (TIGR03847 family)